MHALNLFVLAPILISYALAAQTNLTQQLAKLPKCAVSRITLHMSALRNEFSAKLYRDGTSTLGLGSFAIYDVSFALLALIAVEIEAVLSPYRRGSLAMNAIFVGLPPIASIWQRRAPLGFLALIGLTGAFLSHGLASLHHSTVVGSFALVVGMYTVAAWEPRRHATLGLIAWITGTSALAAVVHAQPGDLLGAMTISVTVWACGRVMRRQRTLTTSMGSYGVVAFLDAGQVSANGVPFTNSWRAGAGVGARYYTSIGPIRLDVAVPLNREPGGDSLELYIGIGQAF